MPSPYVFAALTSLATLALLVALRRDSKAGEWVSKPLASVGFIGAALAAGALATPFGTAVLVGLGFSMVGDLLLISRARGPFLLGLVAFLFGHVAYAVAFVVRGVEPIVALPTLIALTLPAGLVIRWLLPSVEAPMKAPVLAYVIVITTMVALAIATVRAHGNPWIVVGAVAFYLSDLSVARDRFVAPGFGNKAWGLPLYFGAQLILAHCAGRP